MIIHKDKLPLNQTDLYSSINLLIMHVYVLLKTQKIQMFGIFKDILDKPDKISQLYLPSLPHDEDYDLFVDYAKIEKNPFKYYQCGNGHIYTIGDCMKPATVGSCPTCKQKIGGAGYKLEADNKETDVLNQKTQTGYCTQNPYDDKPESIRNMGLLNTSVLRLLLDCVLFLSSSKTSTDFDYYYQHILVSLKRVSNAIQHSPDESILLIHCILNEFKNLNYKEKHFNIDLTKKNDRIKYETIFCDLLNEKIIRNESIDSLLQKLINILKDDSENSNGDQLFRIAHDLIEMPTEDDSFMNEKKFWLFRKQITIENMILTFNNNQENKIKCNLLDRFLTQMKQLETIKYLSNISKMVLLLGSKFNKQIDRKSASSIKFDELISLVSPNEQDLVRMGARDYLNAMKSATGFNLKRNFNTEYYTNLSSLPLSFLLPNNSKDGIFIYSLIVYLINLQNEFIKFYSDLKQIKPSQNDKITISHVEFDNLNINDLIVFSSQKEIQKFVYINSNYSLEAHCETNLEYDFIRIEQFIENKIINDKPFIDIKVNKIYFHLNSI